MENTLDWKTDYTVNTIALFAAAIVGDRETYSNLTTTFTSLTAELSWRHYRTTPVWRASSGSASYGFTRKKKRVQGEPYWVLTTAGCVDATLDTLASIKQTRRWGMS